MHDHQRASTGIEGFDAILDGGLPIDRLYLLHGRPGVGKTTFALQFLRAGVEKGEPCVYVGLSESEEELAAIAASHGWSLDGIDVCDFKHDEGPEEDESEYTFFHPSEIELHDTTREILEILKRVRPRRIVLDSLSELRMMARDSLRYRRQILSLKAYIAEHGATVLLLDTRLAQGSQEFQLETLAHGVIAMEESAPDYGTTRRRLRVGKLRGMPFVEGHHDYRIETGGLRVFPRLLSHRSNGNGKGALPEAGEVVTSGIPELDRMCGGGLGRGSTTMLLGPAGVGKSTIATQYCISAIRRGETVGVFHFDESVQKWWQRVRWLAPDLEDVLEEGQLHLQQINPSEMSPGEFADELRGVVEKHHASVIVIDSLNGYRSAMPEESFLTLHLHELFSFLNDQNVLTLVTAAQHGFVGDELEDPSKLSYLADNVLVLRYFEAFGLLRKAITLIKKRAGSHERFIRELNLAPDGLQVGDELRDFHGILSGELVYAGEEELLIDEEAGHIGQ